MVASPTLGAACLQPGWNPIDISEFRVAVAAYVGTEVVSMTGYGPRRHSGPSPRVEKMSGRHVR